MSLFASVQTGCLIAFALRCLAARGLRRTGARCTIADGISLGIDRGSSAALGHDRLRAPAAFPHARSCAGPSLRGRPCSAWARFAFACRRHGRRRRQARGMPASPVRRTGLQILDFVTVTAVVGGLLGRGDPGRRAGSAPSRRRRGCTVRARLPRQSSIRSGDRRGRPVGRPGASP